MQRTGNLDQRLGKVGKNPPVSILVGIGESGTNDGGAQSHVI